MDQEAPQYVRIFDTTLRDGEQSPGASMTASEKLEVAQRSARLGSRRRSRPASPPRRATTSRRSGLDRGRHRPRFALGAQAPIVARSVAGFGEGHRPGMGSRSPIARRPRIHTFLATSDIHLEHKLRMSARRGTGVGGSAWRGTRRPLCTDVEFSAEDATRSDRAFLHEILAAAVEAGATTINIPDTVGYATPEEMFALVAGILATVPGADRGVIVSVHCHDDLGLATANTLAGLRAGARQAEVTVNGIGERAGNASLEEVVMALRTRATRMKLVTGVDPTHLVRASRAVSACTGMAVQANKAIRGGERFRSRERDPSQDG